MNSIYKGSFVVTQKQKPSHTGMDLVGLYSKDIYSNVNGVIERLGWENPSNHSQGFGQRIWILGDNGLHFVFGHLKSFNPDLKVGDKVKIGDLLGVEGSTGYSTGSHCHYEVRTQIYPKASLNCYEFLDIPNVETTYNVDYKTPEIDKNREKVIKKCPDFTDEFWKYIDNYTVNGINYSKDAYEKLLKYLK